MLCIHIIKRYLKINSRLRILARPTVRVRVWRRRRNVRVFHELNVGAFTLSLCYSPVFTYCHGFIRNSRLRRTDKGTGFFFIFDIMVSQFLHGKSREKRFRKPMFPFGLRTRTCRRKDIDLFLFFKTNVPRFHRFRYRSAVDAQRHKHTTRRCTHL